MTKEIPTSNKTPKTYQNTKIMADSRPPEKKNGSRFKRSNKPSLWFSADTQTSNPTNTHARMNWHRLKRNQGNDIKPWSLQGKTPHSASVARRKTTPSLCAPLAAAAATTNPSLSDEGWRLGWSSSSTSARLRVYTLYRFLVCVCGGGVIVSVRKVVGGRRGHAHRCVFEVGTFSWNEMPTVEWISWIITVEKKYCKTKKVNIAITLQNNLTKKSNNMKFYPKTYLIHLCGWSIPHFLQIDPRKSSIS